MSSRQFFRHLVCFALAASLVAALPAANAASVSEEVREAETLPLEAETGGTGGDTEDGVMQTEEPAVPDADVGETEEEPPVDPETGFSDVPMDRYDYWPIKWAVEHGVIQESSTLFRPDEPITRAQILTMLWRAEGSPATASADSPFFDVSPEDEAYPAILWAYKVGVASGVGDGAFAPERTCTRAELVTFLWRLAGRWPMTGDALTFRDVQPYHYYCSAVGWAVEYGVANGVSKTAFVPGELCSRGDAVTLLRRSYGRAAYPAFLTKNTSGWRCPLDGGYAAGNWVIRDGRYYHFGADGYLDKVSAVAPSLVSLPGYFVHPMKASVYSTREERIEAMISTAYEYLGDPFVVYHSTAPHTGGVDCSGLVMQCLYAAGFDPYPATPEHHSYTEYDSRTLWSEVDMPHIDPADMQRGDLIFYRKTEKAKLINHIAIYLGNGYVIEAWPNKVTDKYPVAGGPHTVIHGVARPIT